LNEFGIFGLPRNVFTKKSGISIPPPLITTKTQKRHSFSSKKYRIKCSGLLPVKLPQNSLNLEAAPTSQIWDLLDYAERQARKRRTVTMAEWSDKLDAVLEENVEE
jgi:hypothetical protein